MREHLRWMADTATLAEFRASLEADPPWQRMRAAVYPDMSDEEAEALRVSMIEALDSGNLMIDFPERYYVINAFRYGNDQAYVASELAWTIMRAPERAEYVIGDHAVTMYDPVVNESRGMTGNALASSPSAETVLPLDRKVAVRLSFDDQGTWEDVKVPASVVEEMNLRGKVEG
jgi:hypothetical protein